MRIPLYWLAALLACACACASASANVTSSIAGAPDAGAPNVSAREAAAQPGTASDQTPLATLGRKLFFDPSLSASGKLACATCHDPKRAYGPPLGKAIALGGPKMTQSGTRAVPSLRYLRSSPPFALDHRFIDGDIAPIGAMSPSMKR